MQEVNYLVLFLQLLVAVGFVTAVMVLTHLVGPKRKTKLKQENTESGIKVIGNARLPFNIKYFVVAILFVLFDVEIIFLYPWAVNMKGMIAEGQGPLMFMEMIIFIATLLIGFFYIIKKGGLKWE